MQTNETPPEDAVELVAASIQAVRESGAAPNLIELTKIAKAERVIYMLGIGETYEAIEQTTGIAYRSIKGIESRHGEVIAHLRKANSHLSAVAATESTKALITKLQTINDDPTVMAKTPLKELGIVYGITKDKDLLDHCKATSISETRQEVSFEDYQATIKQAKARVIEAEEVTPTES
jgi:hypothetical protein